MTLDNNKWLSLQSFRTRCDAKASTRRPGVVETSSKRYDPLALLRQLSREDPSERFDAPPSTRPHAIDQT